MAGRAGRREDVPLPAGRGGAGAEPARPSPRTTCGCTPPTRRPASGSTWGSSASSSSSTCSSSGCTSTPTTSSPSASASSSAGAASSSTRSSTRVGPVDGGRAPQPARGRPGLLALAAVLFFCGWVLRARRQPAEVLLQARPDAQGVRPAGAASRSHGARAGERLLGPVAPRQLPGRAADGLGAGAQPRLARPRWGRGSTRSTTWRCWCRGSSTTTGAAPPSTARCGRSTGAACAGGSFPSSTDARGRGAPRALELPA